MEAVLEVQQLPHGFQTYWWKAVLDCVKTKAETEDEKTAVMANVCCAIGLFRPSETTYKHIVQVLIDTGIPDAKNDNMRTYGLLQKVKTQVRSKWMQMQTWPFVRMKRFPPNAMWLPQHIFDHIYS